MKKFAYIFLGILGGAALLVAASLFATQEAPPLSDDGSVFVFKRGLLWASIGNETPTLGLVDSGTSMSIFPDDWSSLGDKEGVAPVLSPFGVSHLPIQKLAPTTIGGIEFGGKVLVSKSAYPLLGADYIFSRTNVLFSKTGLSFDLDYDPEKSGKCLALSVQHAGRSTDSNVTSVKLLMNIDGTNREVLFDTGRTALLQASFSLPKPSERAFPRMDLRFNSSGSKKLHTYFKRKASIAIGDDLHSVSYRHYFTDKSVGAPFVMGAEILNLYSVLIDHRKGRACFFPVVS